jgi:hypothetical protein
MDEKRRIESGLGASVAVEIHSAGQDFTTDIHCNRQRKHHTAAIIVCLALDQGSIVCIAIERFLSRIRLIGIS